MEQVGHEEEGAGEALVLAGALRVLERAAREQRPRVVQGQQAPLRGGSAGTRARVHRRLRAIPGRISPHFVADPRPVGGSLFRIYRDTRFGKDKTPYKTHTGIQFRHEQARNVHAPGFYLHLEPGQVFAGAGIWRPDSATLGKIREAIAAESGRWTEAVRDSRLGETLRFEGETLKRPPAGYDPAHPLIEDLKRKDFIAVARLSEKTVTSTRFAGALAGTFQATAPLMRFLCGATGVPF